MSSNERNTETDDCTGWCNTYCTHYQEANPVGSSQMQGQHEPENSDVVEKENQRNASKAKKVVIYPPLQDKKTRATGPPVEVPNRQSTEKSNAKVAELNQRLQEEKAKGSKMEEAARWQKQETKALEAKVAELNRLNQRLRGETEAFRQKEKMHKAKTAELSQRLRGETEAYRRQEKETKRLETKVAELTGASWRKNRDIEQLKVQNAELKRLLHEHTVKFSKLEEDARQNSRKERETKRLVAGLGLHLQVKRVNVEGSQRNLRKGECSERLEGEIAELEAKISGMEDDARRREKENRDLSAKNQEQCDEINQLKARVKTLSEQANKPPSKVLVRKPDNTSVVEAGELVRMVNARIEQLSSRVADPFSSRESPGSGAETAESEGLNDLRDYLGPRLINALFHEPNPLILQIALQTVLTQACSRIINHWNPPFWNDDSIFFRVHSNMERTGSIVVGTWSALPRTMSQSEVQEAIVKYLSEIVVKVMTAVGGPLPGGEILPAKYQDDVEDIAERVLGFRQIVDKDVKSMDLVTFTVPYDTPFNPSQMIDEGSTAETGCVICTLEMGLQYRKKAELGKSGGGQCGVTLKPKVVLPAALEA